MSAFFSIEKNIPGSLGRAGRIRTVHGDIETPAFAVVGTKAAVKALSARDIVETGAEVVLANTYHLYLEVGEEVVKKAGGVARFMNWRRSNGEIGPTMTDSGGFQVFSLGAAYGKDISKVLQITDPSRLLPERFDEPRAPKLARIGQDGVSFGLEIGG